MATVDRSKLERVVAVINGKGGVLKTTLVANIAGMLAASDFKVLVVDLDPQGNIAEDFGYTDEDQNDEGRALAAALMFGQEPALYRSVRGNLDVLMGGEALDSASAGLAAKQSKDPTGAKLALARILEKLAPQYDMVLIDCPPGDEMLQTNAVGAARWALVPVKSDKASRKGLTAVAKRLDAVIDVNPDLDLLGVVLVDVGKSAHNVEREARTHVAELFGYADIVLTSTVRHSEATAQATRERGLLVAELDEFVRKGPKWYEVRRGEATAATLAPRTATSVADDLQSVTEEVVARITLAEGADVKESA
ncbi:ParA family protein [Micromonospora sp. DT81.3]|uniref:ParA family protein n=1 Tax=Micromonospora sp. DT81.3 TaxID=3416523 RepID=UPI003CEA3498